MSFSYKMVLSLWLWFLHAWKSHAQNAFPDSGVHLRDGFGMHHSKGDSSNAFSCSAYIYCLLLLWGFKRGLWRFAWLMITTWLFTFAYKVWWQSNFRVTLTVTRQITKLKVVFFNNTESCISGFTEKKLCILIPYGHDHDHSILTHT